MDLLILGASARAAAFSAIRAGLRPHCGDLFADVDLKDSCPAIAVEPGTYPEGLARIAEQAPSGPWLYTGALENHPELVDRISESRPLWGINGDTLRAVRDPIEVARVLHKAGLPCPQVRLHRDGLPLDGSWLVKPLASAGGRQIQPLDSDVEQPSKPVYYQRRIEGASFSSVFLALGGGARLLGTTWQFIGIPGQPFAYFGNIGPWPLRESVAQCLERIGQILAVRFGLLGLFGVDFVLRKQGIPWPVEVNPRYTASVEVLEMAQCRSLLADHIEVFAPGAVPKSQPIFHKPGSPRFVGKWIMHAERDGQFPQDPDWIPQAERPWEPYNVHMADCPRPGTKFRSGNPLFSILVTSEDWRNCSARLKRVIQHWRIRLQDLYVPCPDPGNDKPDSENSAPGPT